MELKHTRLLHSAIANYLPTSLPAQFFGMPDGSVLIVFARFFDGGAKKTDVEFVFAEHQEFRYDCIRNLIIEEDTNFLSNHFERLDKPHPNYEIKGIYRNLANFSSAHQKVNEMAEIMINASTDFEIT
jgi:hypothetical protein